MRISLRLLRSDHFACRSNSAILRQRHASSGTSAQQSRPHNYLAEDNDSVHLRKVFDDQKYFQAFNKKASNSSIFPTRTGLFKNEALCTPNGLVEFSNKSLKEAKTLVANMINDASKSADGRITYIRKLDQLSDILCRVIDVAEFIRVAHPSSKWVNAAQQTHEIMFEYMNQLNTNVELYQHLRDILNDEGITSQLSSEEIQVGEYLKQDFERSGIHMDPHARDNFVSITQEISILGSQFNNELHNLQSYWCELSYPEFESIDDVELKKEIQSFQTKFSNKTNKDMVQVPLAGHIPYSILTNCRAEVVRKKVWIALHNSSDEQIETLNSFLKYRAVLSRMLGFKSYSHYQLEHKMAKNPENVVAFLTKLQDSLKEKGVLKELENIYRFKEGSSSSRNVLAEIKPWDRDYLLGKLQLVNKESKPLEPINDYFSIGTVVAGLSRLFTSLYNVKFVPEPTMKGETWEANQVRKLNVFDIGTNTKLGYLYLDFWSAKVLPSHFTIVCSRRLNESIGTEQRGDLGKVVQLDEDYQLPVISLVCNFQKSHSETIGRFAGIEDNKISLLSMDQVDTIFHEMGHAMHSMLGRTELHNLSGTRCATDFVELPSVLMESFSKDPRVICEIGRHYQTGAKLDPELLASHQKQRVVLDNCETYMQSKMAMLDQQLHNHDLVKLLETGKMRDYSSTEVYHTLEQQLEVFADLWSTWHGKFPHLFSYGAVYYSYLLDRAIAARVWDDLFAANPWSREAGNKYRQSILRWGGTRDPWVCLADALGEDELREGDSRAMEIIGRCI